MSRSATEASPSRPVLRYHGGKWLLAPWVIQHLPPHRVYVEPFGGGASVLLRKPRSSAEVYNDLDGEVCAVFRVLRDPSQARELEQSLRLTPYAREEFDLSYEPSPDPVENARRVIVRGFMGTGTAGITRGSKNGFRFSCHPALGSIPAQQWPGIAESLTVAIDRLQGVIIEHDLAANVVRRYDAPDALFYVDPPYVRGTRGEGMRGNYRHEMTDDDHRALGAALHAATGMIVLSGYPCTLYDRELFSDWHRLERPHLADGARPRTEVLWMNVAAVEAHRARSEQGALEL